MLAVLRYFATKIVKIVGLLVIVSLLLSPAIGPPPLAAQPLPEIEPTAEDLPAEPGADSPPSEVDDADLTPTTSPTVTLTITATIEATATADDSVDDSLSIADNVTPTLAITDVLETSPTATLSGADSVTATLPLTLPTTTPMVTATVTPQEENLTPMATEPEPIEPLEPATETATATLTEIPTETPTLTPSATPTATEPMGSATIEEPGARETPTVTATLTLSQTVAPTPTLTLTVTATPTATSPVAVSDTVTATVPVEGGEVRAFEGRVAVRFPAGAADEALRIVVRPLPTTAEIPYSLSAWPFEIVAEGEASKQPVRRFKQPIQIEVHYEDEWVRGDEESLFLFYFDEEHKGWIPLPSRVDSERNVLVGESDHLTLFDFDWQNWEAAKLPTLAGFQVSQFTGAAQYSYAFDLPQGPGGWQPQLTLNYNSQTVDGATNQTQASWVGMGWSLDTGYVEREMKGTPHVGDDYFTLVLNGASHRLVLGTDGKWHTTDESFLRIDYSANVNTYGGQTGFWTVWDKTGNNYIFGDTGNHRATFPVDDNQAGNDPLWTWRWSLHTATNIYNQSIDYSYVYEGVAKSCGSSSATEGGNDVAVYPSQITYPNGKYRILFDRANRNDYDGSWPGTTNCWRVRFQRSLLSQIRIQHHNGSGWEDVRKYVFGYGMGAGHIFPNMAWNNTQPLSTRYTPTLVSVREWDMNNNTDATVPATTLTYGDGMHLTQADNGYKRRVNFTYSSWWETTALHMTSEEQNAGKCSNSVYGWTYNVATTQMTCNSSGSGLYFKAVTAGLRGTVSAHNYFRIFRPGGVYQIHTGIGANGAVLPRDVRVGFESNLGTNWEVGGAYHTIPPTGILHFDTYAWLPTGAGYMWLNYEGNGIITTFGAAPVLTRYRVAQKSLTDQVTGTTHTFTYSYDEPATNDALHSELIQGGHTDDPEPYTEFRGHAFVRELGPQNRVTLSWYRQNDKLKGRLVRQHSGEEQFYSDFDNLTGWTTTGNVTRLRHRGDAALKLTNANADWNVHALRSAYTMQDQEVALAQFMLSGNGAAILALETNNSRRWGIYVKTDNSVVVQRNDGGGFSEVQTLLSTGQFKRDHWYVLMLGVDTTDLVRLWERDAAPESTNVLRYQAAQVAAGQDWRFRAWSNAGTLYLDTYAELKLQVEHETRYDSAPPVASSQSSVPIYWSRPTFNKTLLFGGDALFTGTQTDYEYQAADQGGTQYGNLTRIIERSWNGSSFVAYRATRRFFYPTHGTNVYLVGLVGLEALYSCPGGSCPYGDAQVQQLRWLLYDNNNWYNTPPTQGKLTKQRTLVCYANDLTQCVGATGAWTRKLFSDAAVSYDSYGNVLSTTSYTGYGYQQGSTLVNASSGARTTSYIYADGGYNTYKRGQDIT